MVFMSFQTNWKDENKMEARKSFIQIKLFWDFELNGVK